MIVALTCAFAEAEAEGFAPGLAVLLVTSAEVPAAPPASTWIVSFSVYVMLTMSPFLIWARFVTSAGATTLTVSPASVLSFT